MSLIYCMLDSDLDFLTDFFPSFGKNGQQSSKCQRFGDDVLPNADHGPTVGAKGSIDQSTSGFVAFDLFYPERAIIFRNIGASSADCRYGTS